MKNGIYPEVRWLIIAGFFAVWAQAEAQPPAGNATVVRANPAGPTPSVPVTGFVGDNLAGLLAPLYSESGSAGAASGNATAGAKGKPGAKNGKKAKNAQKKKGPEANVQAPADDSADVFAGTEVDKVTLETRKQLEALNAQLSKQAAAAPAEQQAIYRQAFGLTKTFNEIVGERDKQVTAVEAVLKTRATTDDADTGNTATGHAAQRDAVAEKEKVAAEKNDDLQNIESRWEKTAAGYQAQVDLQLGQLRAAEQKVAAEPAKAAE